VAGSAMSPLRALVMEDEPSTAVVAFSAVIYQIYPR